MRSKLLSEKKVPLSRIYTKKPKFRRKLIEKYSTRRYNVNTKLVKVTPKYKHRRKILHAVKLERRNARSRWVALSNLPNFLDKVKNEGASIAKTANQTTDFPEANVIASGAVPKCPGLFQKDFEANEIDSLQKAKLDLEEPEVKSERGVLLPSSVSSDFVINVPDFMRGELKRLKLVSLSFYSFLTERANSQKSPVKPVKKRKKILTAPKKRNYNQTKKNVVIPSEDPYLENWESFNSSPINDCEKNVALIVHLGVGRPLFPIIHRNIITLCLKKDTEITDMWAEFSLSTLITQPSDRVAKVVLMPVVNDQLLSTVSDFNKKCDIDFDEIEVRKVTRPPLHDPINVEEEPSLPTSISQDQKTRRSKLRSKSKKTHKPVSLIQQIYRKSLKNRKKCEFIENSLLEKSSKSLHDKECYLQKFGCRPCWVVVPRLPLGGNSLKGKTDTPKLTKSSPPKSILLNKKERSSLYKTSRASPKKKPSLPNSSIPVSSSSFPPREIENLLSICSKEKELTDENSTMSRSLRPIRNRTPRKLTFSDEKSSSLIKTVSFQPTTILKKPTIQRHTLPILSSNETTCPSSIATEMRLVAQNQKLPIPSLNEATRSPFIASKRKTRVTFSDTISVSPTTERVIYSDQKTPTICNSILSTLLTMAEKATASSHQDSYSLMRKEQRVPVKPVKSDTPTKTTPPSHIEVINSFVEDEDTEWISMDHYFDTHCSRTYGPMLDYIPRNKTLVYFFKMSRILKFQTKNNKYFKSCSYLRIQRSMEDDFIDVLNEVEGFDEVEVMGNGPKSFKDILKDKGFMKPSSSNPSEIMRFPKLIHAFGFSVVKCIDNQCQYPFRSIEKDDLQNLSNTKWIILRLDEDVVQIVFNKKFELPAKLLFDIMYRADLTNKIIGYTIDETSSGSPSLYGIPGMCDAVILGPCQTPERCNSLSAVFQNDSGGTEVVDIPITTFRTVFTVNQPGAPNIEAVWWRPVNAPLKVTSINAAYLNFLFKWYHNPDPEDQNTRLRLSTILRKHLAVDCARFTFGEGEENYVLIHDPTEPYPLPSTTIAEDKTVAAVHNTRKMQKKSLKAQGDGKRDKPKRTSKTISESSLPRSAESRSGFELPESSTSSETLRLREKLRRAELRRNRSFLNSMLAGVKPIASTDIALNSVVKQAIDSIGLLNMRNVQLLREKEFVMTQRKELISKYVSLLKDLDKKCALYQMSRRIIPQLLLPRHAERLEKEERQKMSRESHPGKSSYSITTSTSYEGKRKRRRKRRRVLNTEEGKEYSNPHGTCATQASPPKPVRVTVQSRDHVIGLGPYTEHNYCNFIEVNSTEDLAEDPLADSNFGTNFKQNDEETDDNAIHICITEKGKPIFKLAINRLSDSKVGKNKPPQNGVELKKLIQRILQQMQFKLDKGGLSSGKGQNHIQMLHNIVSDTRNEKLFLGTPKHGGLPNRYHDDVVSIDDKDYAYRVQHSDGKTPFLNNYKNTINRVSSHELESSHIVDAENEYFRERFVSIDQLIADSAKLDGQECPKKFVNRGKLSRGDHFSCVPSTSNEKLYNYGRSAYVSSTSSIKTKKLLLPEGMTPEECIIEEQCVENNLDMEKEFASGHDRSFLGSKKQIVSVRNNVIIARSQESPIVLQPPRMGLHTVPVLRKVYDDGSSLPRKTIPLILRRSIPRLPVKLPVNVCVVPKKPNPAPHLRCPSFVPIPCPASSHSLRCSVEDGKYRNESFHEKNESYSASPELEENGNSTQHKYTGASNSQSVESLINHDAKVENDGNKNEASAPFRLSVKPFASIGAFTDGVCSNVDKLLK